MDASTVLVVQIFSAIASICAFSITFFFKKNQEVNYFRMMSGISALWAIFYGLEIFLPDLDQKVLFMQLRFILAPFLMLAILMIASKHFGWERLLGWKSKAVLFTFPILTAIVVATWNYHHLFRYDFALKSIGDLTVVSYNAGVWYSFYMIFAYVLTVLSVTISVSAVRGANKVYARQGLVFFIAIVAPLFPDIVFQLGLSPIPGYNLSSAMFLVSSLLIFWSIYRMQMLNIKPVVRAEVMERLTDPVLLLDDRERLMDFNSAAVTAFSWDGSSQIGSNVADLLPDIVPLLNMGDGHTHFPEMALFKHGMKVIYEVNTTNVLINGEIKERIVILRDVTIRRNAQDALKENERQYRELLERAPFPVVLTNLDNGRVLFINEKAVKKFEMPREIAIGSLAINFYVNPEDRAKLIAGLKEAGVVSDLEAQMKSSSGNKFWAYISSTTITYEGHNSLFAAFNDISERKQMEDALKVTNKKMMLLSSISRHDMVNQMTVLSGYLAVAQSNPESDKLKNAFARMEASIKSLQNMIEFTKDYQDLGAKEPAWFNLAELVDRSRRKVNLGKIEVEMDLNGAKVYGDALLEKVFFNLFDNALRHGRKITLIKIGIVEGQGGAVIYFQDDGVGVPAEDKERIFQRGFGKNTGLGLFLSREILAITGMTIKENGVSGEGARFEIFVPPKMFRMESS